MLSLIIDTSTPLGLIALSKEGQIVAEHAFVHFNALSKNLLPYIKEFIEKQNLRLSELSSIAAGIGPGSYTGTRLGAAVAKTLAFGLNIPVIPFCSPLAFIPEQKGSFAFLLPTRANQYFLLKGFLETDRLIQESATLIAAEALTAYAQNVNFLICSHEHSLPDELTAITRFEPSLNLHRLGQFLNLEKAISPEDVQLQYLHTPF